MYEKNPDRNIFFTAKVVIHGKGGHSSVPVLTRNPIPAAFRLIQIISGKLLYEFSSFQNVAFFPVSFDSGRQQNIIPDDAEIVFRGEAVTDGEKDALILILTESLKALEALYQVKASVECGEIDGQN